MKVMGSALKRRMERIRDDYYGGKLSILAAQEMLEPLYCEFLPCRCGGTRRKIAAQMAMEYLKPDISGLLEAYEG